MTVGAKVKGTVASLKGVEASLHQFYLHAEVDELKAILLKGVNTIRNIVGDLESRVAQLEAEEPQYKGF